MPKTPTREALAAALAHHGEALVTAVREADPAAAVPACPGWDVDDLAWHVGQVWARFGSAVAHGWTTAEQLGGYEAPPRPSPEDMPTWLAERLLDLVATLNEADPATEVWNWTPGAHDVVWVRRRLAHENLVHHLDLADVLGQRVEVDPDMAADGVDEFFPTYSVRYGGGPLDGAVQLLAADADASWHLEREGDGLKVLPPRGEVAATVEGDAVQLLRWVWRRSADVEVTGDAEIAWQLRDFCFPDR